MTRRISRTVELESSRRTSQAKFERVETPSDPSNGTPRLLGLPSTIAFPFLSGPDSGVCSRFLEIRDRNQGALP